MVELRDYQQDLLGRAQDALAAPKARALMQLPTGGGKTRIAAALLYWWLGNGRKAVWLTHRTELSNQTCGVLNKSGVPAVNTLEWYVDDPAPTWQSGVVILMAQTVSRRNRFNVVWRRYNPQDLLIIDEAHHATAAGWARAIRQWPGPVVGLTATPWRLSKTEGFDHLFNTLILGPQIADLQYQGHLANAKVLMPEPDDLILGGEITATGDYSEAGIVGANQGREIWTAGVLRFWQRYAQDRQTIVYAVSVAHAENLIAVFNEANIPAAALLGDTPLPEREQSIRRFSDNRLKVLVNVAVATEGFDLPDAACVVLTRPTMSLALYLQMVGRGLRPKSDGGNCLILDLAGNVERHGFPEDNRKWSLAPRGQQDGLGSKPVVRCPECAGVSPAASHHCRECGHPFGKDCGRCGKWRAWQTWSAETLCGDEHDLVCNRCHIDAHDRANLPEQLKEVLRQEALPVGNPDHLHTLEEVQARQDEALDELSQVALVGDRQALNSLCAEITALSYKKALLLEARIPDAVFGLPEVSELDNMMETLGEGKITRIVLYRAADGEVRISVKPNRTSYWRKKLSDMESLYLKFRKS